VNFGSSSVDIVSDGMMMVDGGTVFGPIPKAHWELSIKPDRRNRVRLGLNCLLVRTPGANILVDTGVGSKRTEKLKEKYALNGNKLLKNLRAHGLTARDIDLVILTHLHFDHGGGCTKLDRSGNAVPTFPKAEYMVQKRCLDEAHNPNERFEDSFYDDDFIPLERNGVLKTIDGDTEVIPGLTVRVTDGPSSGHQVVLVERGSERIAFASDLIPTPYHLPLPHISATDEYPNETLEQKKKLLEMAVGGGWLMVFGHGHDYPAGYVQRKNGSTQLRPVDI
jgi:glyoxylase-like metal-dependent hydrolase (beta-lactamase superfamily II)